MPQVKNCVPVWKIGRKQNAHRNNGIILFQLLNKISNVGPGFQLVVKNLKLFFKFLKRF